ncbi:MAG: hypothetical protein AAGN46_01365 [Acidobacteriota bacterium]
MTTSPSPGPALPPEVAAAADALYEAIFEHGPDLQISTSVLSGALGRISDRIEAEAEHRVGEGFEEVGRPLVALAALEDQCDSFEELEFRFTALAFQIQIMAGQAPEKRLAGQRLLGSMARAIGMAAGAQAEVIPVQAPTGEPS